jgi:glycosyltransferase involved in cell wall biosynthesis
MMNTIQALPSSTTSDGLKIAYIGIKGLPSNAGADRVVEAIVRRLAARHELTVYCSSLAVPAGATFPGVELARVPVLRGKHAHAATLFLMAALDALVRRDFDLVHVHNVEASFVLPLLKPKYPIIATSHGLAYARDKWSGAAKSLIRLTDWPYIKLADCVTSVSGPVAEYYTSRYRKPVAYIPNGVGPEDTTLDLDGARELLQAQGVQPQGYILFAAGRIIPTKGAEILLEAYRALSTDLPLLVVGDTGQTPAYERLLHQLADERVVFLPSVNKALLLGLARLARLFVFPSTVEAMSMMLLEAAVTGAPIVSSDIPENVAVLPEQALFFRSRDAGDLCKKMAWALDHPDRMQELGARASTWVNEQYQWDSIVDQYERLYYAWARKAKPR